MGFGKIRNLQGASQPQRSRMRLFEILDGTSVIVVSQHTFYPRLYAAIEINWELHIKVTDCQNILGKIAVSISDRGSFVLGRRS
jgi:hypothetical protein